MSRITRHARTALGGILLGATSLSLAPVAGLATAGTAGTLEAQHDPRVEPARTYAITGATVHTMAGRTIENGTVILQDGVITQVGAGLSVPSGASVIDASGMHVYPGMVDAFTRLGLTEIGAVNASNDASEITNWNPQLTAATAVHPASEHIPVTRANGVTHALTAPGGGGGFGGGGSGGIPGRAALMHLDGWTIEEMAINPSAAMVVQWPTIQTRTFNFNTFSVEEKPFTEAKREFDEKVDELRDWFEAAAHYRQATQQGDASRFDRNIKLEHLARTLGGGLPVIAVANEKRSIESAMAFAEEWDLDLVIAGGEEAREVKQELAERGIPVILGPTQSTPDQEDDPYYYPQSLPGELYEAGVKFAFATFNSSDSRTLPYEAANAVPFGLPREEAMKAITVNGAEILGVGDQLGTVEDGKVGNLIVTTGDPLEIQTRMEYLFIKGMPVDRMNKHLELYQEYRARPERLEAAGPGGR